MFNFLIRKTLSFIKFNFINYKERLYIYIYIVSVYENKNTEKKLNKLISNRNHSQIDHFDVLIIV